MIYIKLLNFSNVKSLKSQEYIQCADKLILYKNYLLTYAPNVEDNEIQTQRANILTDKRYLCIFVLHKYSSSILLHFALMSFEGTNLERQTLRPRLWKCRSWEAIVLFVNGCFFYLNLIDESAILNSAESIGI